ncbi:hypothetical protein ACQKH5_18530 [Hyphomonas sp. NPDC076900]|uniref:hypothetical protein n=1 Tax=unclassified Hyphomonas TaxID=2630699 RepID=UPI003D0046A0
MNSNVEGSLVTIPTEGGWGVAKIIFQSEQYANTICLKLYKKRFLEGASIGANDFSGPFDLYYTSLDGFKKKRWTIVANELVSGDEKALTRRTSGGEVWVEDTHLGTATEADLAALPKMLTHGFKLIEKYVGRYPVAVAG